MRLIDKDAVVAEIEKRLKQNIATNEGALVEDMDILSFLDTLEVKKVDLKKEVETYMNIHNLHTQDGGRIVFENGDAPNLWCDFRDIAEYFFELGLKTQKGE